MAEKGRGPGPNHDFQAFQGECQAENGDREASTSSKEAMKCGYCDKLDHLVSSCPMKARERRFEVALGCFFIFWLFWFWAIGAIVGAIWSCLKAGFAIGDGMWPQTWNAMRGKGKDDGESLSG